MEKSEKLCPCSSGKPLKNCCFTKKNKMLEKHWTSIKVRVVQTFLAEHPTPDEQVAISEWISESKMAAFEDEIETVSLEYLLTDVFFFTVNREKWGYHLIKNMKSIVQPKTHTILTSWQKPFFFIGTVTDRIDEYLIVKHMWTDETIYIGDIELEDVVDGSVILGHVIPGVHEHFYNLLSSAIVLEEEQKSNFDGWLEAYENSVHTDLESFFEKELINCLYNLIEATSFLNDEEKPVDPEIMQLIVSLDMHLLELGIRNNEISFVFFNYLMTTGEQRKTRKKQGLIAAVIQFGIRYDFLPKAITQKKMSELFSVSPSTIARNSRKIELYFEQDFDKQILESIRQRFFEVGTDPTVQEYVEWQREKKMDKLAFTTGLEKKRIEKKLKNTSYTPMNPADKAQKYAYEAYLSESFTKRIELAKLARMNDPENLDANIILSEKENLEKRLETMNLLKTNSTSELRVAFLKVTIYYRLEKYEEALKIIEQLPKEQLESHTQLYYFFCLIHYLLGNPLFVIHLVNEHSKGEMNSFLHWITWIVAREVEEGLDQSFHLLAVQANPFVQKYIDLKMEPFDYPTKLLCYSGDPNEGKLIHFMIYPFLSE